MFIDILPADITTLFGYMNSLISDFWPIILAILGVSLGLMIIRSILHLN